jgi:hypothetical protein
MQRAHNVDALSSPMSSWKSSLLAAVVAAVVAALAFRDYRHRRQVEAADLRRSNSELSLAVSRRLEPGAASAGAPARATAQPGFMAAARQSGGHYRNDGRGSPLSTLQTFAWACSQRDTAAIARMLLFDGGGRRKVENYLQSLPSGQAAPGKSPEEMAAVLLQQMYQAHPFPKAERLDQATFDPVSDGRATLREPDYSSLNGRQFQLTPAGWSYVIPEVMVDNYLARVRPAAAGP